MTIPKKRAAEYGPKTTGFGSFNSWIAGLYHRSSSDPDSPSSPANVGF